MKIAEITEYRSIYKRKYYVIDTKESIYFIKGSYIREFSIENPTNLIDSFLKFQDGNMEWNRLENRIDYNFSQENNLWVYLSKSEREKELEVESVFADGEKII